jgi:hypothetical protein
MLLPDKHIRLSESLLGLGAFVLSLLDKPQTADQLYLKVKDAREDGSLPAFHDFDSVSLAVLFLYSIGVVEANEFGAIRRCAS